MKLIYINELIGWIVLYLIILAESAGIGYLAGLVAGYHL